MPRIWSPRNRWILAGVLTLALWTAGWIAFRPYSCALESTARGIAAPGAPDPVRVARWGAVGCYIPFQGLGDYPWVDLVYDAGSETPAAYREQWRSALIAEGWASHGPATVRSYLVLEWWTKHDLALELLLETDDRRGSAFRWGDGELLVSVRSAGLGRGRLPATGTPRDWAPEEFQPMG